LLVISKGQQFFSLTCRHDSVFTHLDEVITPKSKKRKVKERRENVLVHIFCSKIFFSQF
jgi:hypothetical protein